MDCFFGEYFVVEVVAVEFVNVVVAVVVVANVVVVAVVVVANFVVVANVVVVARDQSVAGVLLRCYQKQNSIFPSLPLFSIVSSLRATKWKKRFK